MVGLPDGRQPRVWRLANLGSLGTHDTGTDRTVCSLTDGVVQARCRSPLLKAAHRPRAHNPARVALIHPARPRVNAGRAHATEEARSDPLIDPEDLPHAATCPARDFAARGRGWRMEVVTGPCGPVRPSWRDPSELPDPRRRPVAGPDRVASK